MSPKNRVYSVPVIIFGAVLVIVAAYYCAGAMEPGETIFQWYERMNLVVENPYEMYWNEYTIKTMFGFLVGYAFAVMMYIASRRNYLPGKEMGSAKFADVKAVNAKLADLSRDVDDPKNIVIRKRRWYRR